MSIKKICTFFVSDYHLLTIILPYINETINDKKNTVIISENDLTSSVKKYLNNVEELPFEKYQLLDLDWKNFKDKIDDLDFREKNVFVIGKERFIRNINNKLEIKELENIINCYKINCFNDFEKIPQNYEYVLSTTGIKRLNKNSQDEQKRKTIQSQF